MSDRITEIRLNCRTLNDDFCSPNCKSRDVFSMSVTPSMWDVYHVDFERYCENVEFNIEIILPQHIAD